MAEDFERILNNAANDNDKVRVVTGEQIQAVGRGWFENVSAAKSHAGLDRVAKMLNQIREDLQNTEGKSEGYKQLAAHLTPHVTLAFQELERKRGQKDLPDVDPS